MKNSGSLIAAMGISKSTLWVAVMALWVISSLTVAFAVPASPKGITVQQPNGQSIRVFLRGDEFLHWNEDEAGYTIVKESSAGAWVYAVRDASGQLTASKNRVGEADPAALGLSKRLQPANAVARATAAAQSRSARSGKKAPTTGTMKNLVLLVSFSDSAITTPVADFNELFNTIGYSADGAQGSVKDYYNEASYNQLEVDSVVVAPVTLANGYAYYGANDAWGYDVRPQEMVEEALAALEARGFDFSTLDSDDDGWVDGLTVIHAGGAEEYGGNDEDYIWSHQWDLNSPVTYDGKQLQTYHTEPARRGWDDDATTQGITRIGVICHENGHFLGLPDLYDYDYDSEGVGEFCLMSGGSWNGDYGTQPAHFSAWCKTSLGWVTPTVVSSAGTYTVDQAEDNQVVYRLNGAFPANEYILVENRQGTGFDASMPGTVRGLLIWHVDEDQPNNDDQTHFHVDLEEASGVQHLQLGTSSGDDDDYFRTDTLTAFKSNSTPNNRSYSGTFLGLEITAISDSGPAMTFTIPEPPRLTIDPASGYGVTSLDAIDLPITVDANIPWTATESFSWLSITAGSPGNGPGTVLFSVLANDRTTARTGWVVVAGSGISRTCTVVQAGAPPSLAITPASTTLPAVGAVGRTITVDANMPWTAAPQTAWLSISSGATGDGPGAATVQAAQNNWTAPRTGTVVVAGSGLSRTCTVVQDPAAPVLFLTPGNRHHSGAAASDQTISVSANTEWTATSSAGWLVLTAGLAGAGNADILYQVSINRDGPRSGTITVAGNGIERTFTVVQDLWIDPDVYEVDNASSAAKWIASGQTQNRSIHASGDADWAKFTVGSQGALNFRLETAGASGYDTALYLYQSNGSLLGYDDDNGAGHYSRIIVDYLVPGTYFAKILEFGNNGTIPFYTLQASWVATSPPPDVYESDNTASAAKFISNGQTQSRSIHAVGDVDWVKFTVGRRGAKNLQVQTSGTIGDTQLWLYRSDGTKVAFNDDYGVGRFSKITMRALPAGTYLIKIQEDGNNGKISSYQLRAAWSNP